MTATLLHLPTHAQQRHAESERNAILEADNAWLEAQLVEAMGANADLARGVLVEEARADKAERRLRSRLIELSWPACLCALVGAFAAVFAIRWAGL